MGVFNRRDDEFIRKVQNKHLRKVLLERLEKGRVAANVLCGAAFICVLIDLADDFSAQAFGLMGWVVFVVLSAGLDQEIRAIKLYAKTEESNSTDGG